MSYYHPGAPPPENQPDGQDHPGEPTARTAPPWWRGRVVVATLALALGTIVGAALVIPPDSTATAGAAPQPTPTVTETAPVPQERIEELDAREKSLNARDKRLDNRQEELEEHEEELDGRETGIDGRTGKLDERETGLDDREAGLDEREGGLDDRDSAITQAEEEVAANTIPADGTYLVGDEIEPGTYRASGNGDRCYWVRLSGLSGEFDDLITNYLGAAKTTVEIQPGDVAFETSRCGEWVKIS